MTSALYDVLSIPTLILLRDGEQVARTVGLVRQSDLTALLDDALAPTETPAKG